MRDLVDAGDPPSALTPERLAAAAEAVVGEPVAIDEATLRDALDPAACAEPAARPARRRRRRWTRCSPGSTQTLAAHEAWSDGAREREAAAEAALLDRARELAS